ncbi:MAG TPA: hAT family dimerization domain-containing protein [Lactovum miscens]|uniref:hAT family dimerization domain-containing protein n=1 Tax=Lactovum miscens TaxID=190387 RepID=UPI002ED7A75E
MERHPTITAYLPTFHWLLDALHSFISDNPGPLAVAAENGLDKLQKYEDELQLNKSQIPYFAVILNPASKMSFFKEHKFRNVREIQKVFTDYFEKEYVIGIENVECNELEHPEDELFAFMYKRPKVTKSTKEIQKYLQFPLSSFKVNILEFWQSHQHDFPALSKMARDILPVQGASVAVERDLSDAADIVTVNRCSLTKETIRKLMCLKDWYKI